ncbi:MAG: ATP-binding protein [Candidatus Dadabacteria bacterium]|nr:ATP-binding protein [Candidatus Dadabacteria bacterium]
MSSPKIEFSSRFINFLDDPGIRIGRPGGGAVTLPEVFVYPDLAPFGTGTGAISSSSLLDPAYARSPVVVTGPEDSGKTSLLKSLAVKALGEGFLPVYIDGREAPADNPADVLEAARTAAEAQYAPGSAALVNGPGAKKRVLLFDNFDLAGWPGPEALDRAFLEEFALVILTASYPYPSYENSFSIAEMDRERRDELIRKWVRLRTADSDEAASLVEKARGVADAVLGRNLVPSYPVFVLTILESSVPAGASGQAGSSYGHYYEYAVTKPLREGSTGAEFGLYSEVLSALAYSRLAGGGRAADKEELAGLILRHAPDADPEDIIDAFLRSKTLRESGAAYEFASAHAYHYFAALYLSRNVSAAEVRDKIAALFSQLGDGDNAGGALFLAYRSSDPFVTEQIGRGVGLASGENTRRTDKEREAFIDELIAGLERDEPGELHEMLADYQVRRALGEIAPLSGNPGSNAPRLPSNAARLRVLTEALNAGHAGSAAGSAYSLWEAYLSGRLSEIDALRRGKRVKSMDREEKLRLLLLYEGAYGEALRLLSFLTASGLPVPEGPYALAAALLRPDPDVSRAARFAEENPDRRLARSLIKIAAAESLRLFPHKPETEKELKNITKGYIGDKVY